MPKSPRETIKSALEKCIELHEDKKYEVAEIVLRQALRAFSEQYYTERDELAEENLSKGMEYLSRMDAETAVGFFEEAYRLKPDSRVAFINCTYCNFHLGNYQKVWTLYEERIRHFDQLVAYKKMFDPAKRWNGIDSLNNKKVLIFCEQGMGYTINFSRYLKHLKKRGCKIILNCADALVDLFKINSFNFIIDEIVSKEAVTRDWVPEHDYHLPLMSLPYLLKMYEPCPETYIDIYQKSMVANHKDFRIGFIWKGSPLSGNDKIRSVNIHWFKRLMLPNVSLHSLHHSEKPAEGMADHSGEI